MKKNVRTILAIALMLVLAALALLARNSFRPDPIAGNKNLTVTVVHGDGSEKVFELKTDCDTLGEPLKKEGIISGTEGEFGMYILTVDGETADEAIQQWWCITKGGQMWMQGIDETVIADGESYEISLKTGW